MKKDRFRKNSVKMSTKGKNNRHKTHNMLTAMMINRENDEKRKPEKLVHTKVSEVFRK